MPAETGGSMWQTVCCLLLSVSLAAAGPRSQDIPLEAAIVTLSDRDAGLSSLEERLVRLETHLETLGEALDSRLAQLDAGLLQLSGRLGSCRPAGTPDPAGLLDALSQQLRQSERLLESQLNDTEGRLAALVEAARPAAAEPAATTVIVERCSYRDQFQATDEWRPADCAAIQQRHQRSGVYTIFPPVCGNGGGIRVFCDMETDGGGWTVLLRRTDLPQQQDFNLGWDSYKWGFGNLSGEFWLGNEYVSLLTSMDQIQLRVDLGDWSNASAFAMYTPFSVGTEQQKYALKIGKYEGNAGNSLQYSNGMKFSTKDQDNDQGSGNCAITVASGWWFKSCFEANLTGQYKSAVLKKAWHGLVWKHWKGEKYSLKHAEMKIRPVNYMTWCHRLSKEGARE